MDEKTLLNDSRTVSDDELDQVSGGAWTLGSNEDLCSEPLLELKDQASPCIFVEDKLDKRTDRLYSS